MLSVAKRDENSGDACTKPSRKTSAVLKIEGDEAQLSGRAHVRAQKSAAAGLCADSSVPGAFADGCDQCIFRNWSLAVSWQTKLYIVLVESYLVSGKGRLNTLSLRRASLSLTCGGESVAMIAAGLWAQSQGWGRRLPAGRGGPFPSSGAAGLWGSPLACPRRKRTEAGGRGSPLSGPAGICAYGGSQAGFAPKHDLTSLRRKQKSHIKDA